MTTPTPTPEATARPAPPEAPPEGYHWRARVDPQWRLVTGKRCRRRLDGPGHVYCTADAVAEFDRSWGIGPKRRWWAYCPHHLYGRWIEDGQVMGWVLRKDGAE